MPKVGQAPAVIPIPELSERERQDRLQDIESVINKHGNIQKNISKVLPLLDEILREQLLLRHACETSPPIRAVRLARRLRTDESLRTIAAAKYHLQRLANEQRSQMHFDSAKREILEPDIPGVVRDPRDIREAVRQQSKR